MDDLIRSCLRMKPHRILVGEVRGTEALTAMEAWNTGHPGGSMTIHANNAMEGLNRIVFLCQKTANPFPTHILARIVAETIHLVVYIEAGRQFPCGRKVKEVCLVKGTMENASRLNSFRHSLLLHDMDIQPERRR